MEDDESNNQPPWRQQHDTTTTTTQQSSSLFRSNSTPVYSTKPTEATTSAAGQLFDSSTLAEANDASSSVGCLSLQMEIDHMTKNGFIESMVTIRLPGLDYHLTDPEYSGHKNIVPIILDEGKDDPTIIFMFDLVKRDPSMSSKFSHQAENKMEDDLELG